MATKLAQLFTLLSNWRKVEAELAPSERTQEICASVYTLVSNALPRKSGTDYVGVIGAAGKDLVVGSILRKVEVVCTFRDYTPAAAACAKKLAILEAALKESDAPIKELTKKDHSVHFRFRGVEVEVYPAPVDVDWYNLPANQVVFALPTARLHQTLWFLQQPPEVHGLTRLALQWVNALWGGSKSRPSTELIEHLAAYAISTLSPKNRSPKKSFQAFLEIGADVKQHIVLQDYFSDPIVPVIGHERIIMDVANPRHNLAGPSVNWKLWAQAAEFTNTALKEGEKFSARAPASLGTWIPPPSPDNVIYLGSLSPTKAIALVTKAFANKATTAVEVDGVATAAEKANQVFEAIDKEKFTVTNFRTHDVEGNPVRALLIRQKKQRKERKQGEEGENAPEKEPRAEGESKPRRNRRPKKAAAESNNTEEAPKEAAGEEKPQEKQQEKPREKRQPKPRGKTEEQKTEAAEEGKQPRQRAPRGPRRGRKAAPTGVWRQKQEE